MEPGSTFNAVASAYDAHRAGYPAALFDDLKIIAGLAPGDHALEIGCGAGQATTGLLGLGLDVTAIDPGLALVAHARQRFAGTDEVAKVRFAVSRFEDWSAADESFRLIAAAQSWHWLDPKSSFAKVARLTAPGGSLAIFGHTPRWSAKLMAHLEPVYRTLAPEIWAPPGENWYLPEGPIRDIIAASGAFEAAECRSYAWSRRHKPQSFTAYLGTVSRTNSLPTDRREAFLAAVEAALPADVDTDWVSTLYVARRRISITTAIAP
ncbi:MAG TPA: methyltransferase domain-containing protein [Magnetospirillaceae bacterium]|jgi:SAM-dependent methyltransferase